MDYFDFLEKYRLKDNFTFEPHEDFEQKCNAPTDNGGVYLIYKIKDTLETLVYIGSSGQRDKNGKLKIRQGGLFDRLVNGYHPNRFGEIKRIKRKRAFPKHMKNTGISKIVIYWWATFNGDYFDFPTDIEKKLTSDYFNKYKRLPEWHKQ
jgi:hypothetical protein